LSLYLLKSLKSNKKSSKKQFRAIGLDEDANQLNEVVIRSEKTTVEIKLDKKSIR
jgi:flagellar hook-basal body complex protein FliE